MLYFSADDDLSDMVGPRLIESGADLSRILAVNDMLPFTLADESIEKLIEDFNIHVMIVDPIQEYLEYEAYCKTKGYILIKSISYLHRYIDEIYEAAQIHEKQA